MKIQKQFIPFFLLLSIAWLTGCATIAGDPNAPRVESPEERLAAFEIAYQEILRTATRWRVEGSLSDSAIAKFDQAFDQYEAARTAALAALYVRTAASAAESDQAITNVAIALGALRSLLQANKP